MRAPRATEGDAAPLSTNTRRRQQEVEFAFSPPTTKLGDSHHIKRKLSVNSRAAPATAAPDASESGKKQRTGGLFASVLANSR